MPFSMNFVWGGGWRLLFALQCVSRFILELNIMSLLFYICYPKANTQKCKSKLNLTSDSYHKTIKKKIMNSKDYFEVGEKENNTIKVYYTFLYQNIMLIFYIYRPIQTI